MKRPAPKPRLALTLAALVLIAAVAAIATSCRKPAPKPDASIDGLFRQYLERLPEPADESEASGFGPRCPRHAQATYTLLAAAAAKLPIKTDDDLTRVVPWMRHEDVCLRQIAIDAVIPRIGYDRNRLTSHTHNPESWEYHDVFVTLKTWLDAKHVAYAPALFDGLMLSLREQDFASTLAGTWQEDDKDKTLIRVVTIEPGKLSVTAKHIPPDPQSPDRTSSFEIERVSLNERLQFVVATKSEASKRVYTFWPASKNAVFFDNGVSNDWIALARDL